MIRVLIVDDHVLFRKGLKMILEENEGISVTGEASSGREAIEKAMAEDFDIVILDITMPGGSGLDALGELKSRKPELPVLILTQHPEEQFAVRALKAGALGYVMKIRAPEELMTAIWKVLKGEKYVSPVLAEALAYTLSGTPARLPHETLSRREFQVMLLLASGDTMTEIAHQLGLSVNTINTYRIRIIEKLGLKTTSDIIHYAVKNQLV